MANDLAMSIGQFFEPTRARMNELSASKIYRATRCIIEVLVPAPSPIASAFGAKCRAAGFLLNREHFGLDWGV
jgi:hypothetical protein